MLSLFSALLVALAGALPRQDPAANQSEPSHLDFHPAQAEVFVETPDVQALLAAYDQAPMVQLFRDEAALGALRRILGQPALSGEGLVRTGVEAAPFLDGLLGKAYERRNELRAFSCSLSGSGEKTDAAALIVLDWSSADAAAAIADALAAREGKDAGAKAPAGAERFRATPGAWSLQEKSRVVVGAGSMTAERWTALAQGSEPSLADGGAAREAAEGLSASGVVVLRGFHRRNPFAVAADVLPEGAGGMMAFFADASRWLLGDGPMRWRMSLAQGRFLTEMFQPGATGPIASADWLGQAPLDAAALASAHPGALLVAATTIDGGAMQTALLNSVGASSGRSADSLREELDLKLGFSSAELCAKLGPSAVLFVQPVRGIGVPGTFLVVDLKSTEGVLDGLVALVGALAPAAPGLAAKTQTYKDVPWVALTLPADVASLGDAATLKPCFAVLDGKLVACNGSLDLKKEIRRRQGDPKEQLPPASYPWLRSASSVPTGATGLVFIDWAAQVDGILSMARAFGPMLGQFGGGLPFDLENLPAAETFTKYMPPTILTVRAADGGVATRRESAFAFETWTGLAGLSIEIQNALAGVTPSTVRAESGREGGESARDPLIETHKGLSELRTALAVYRIEAKRAPEALEALLRPTANYPQGFLDGAKALPLDGWGRPFRYQPDPDGAAYRLWSTGPDGQDQGGGGDDVQDL